MVVDDELDMRIYISTVLETSGYRPVVTKNGKEGVVKAREIRPDLIVLDVMMPGRAGVLMYRALKTDPDLASIPVVMLSGGEKGDLLPLPENAQRQSEEKILEPEAYLEKPPDHEELLETIESILG